MLHIDQRVFLFLFSVDIPLQGRNIGPGGSKHSSTISKNGLSNVPDHQQNMARNGGQCGGYIFNR